MSENRKVDYIPLSNAVGTWIANQVKSAGAGGVVLGLSGGIDSGVCAALAAKWLGAENVLCLSLPCYSLSEDTEDALRLVSLLKVNFQIINLDSVFDTFLKAGNLNSQDRLNSANIKARLRMTMLYAYSRGKLVLGTSNYSEIKVGYWTKWGDGASDLLPLGRLYKDEIREIAGALGLPEWLLKRVPSAGLWPGQSDEEEMGVSYSQIKKYFNAGNISSDVSSRIENMVRKSEHKRKPIPFFNAREWIKNHEK